MRKFLSFILATSLSLGLYAQSKEVLFKFNHLYNGTPFNLNELYLVDENTPIEFDRMEFYLHINNLVTSTDESIELEDSYLLVNPNQSEYSIGQHPVSNIHSLLFHIGVAPEVNHNDPSLLPSNHPLSPQDPSMHWGWAAGYRFIAVEGMIDKNLDGILEAVIQYHAVDDAYYSSISISNASIETESSITFHLDINYEKMFEDINTSDAGVFHGSHPQNQSLIDNIANNNVFSVTENLNINEETFSNSFYPNPFTDHISLNLSNNSQVYLHSVQGKLIKNYNLERGLHLIHSLGLKNGIYILTIKNDSHTESKILFKE